jgi:hypothetical protein
MAACYTCGEVIVDDDDVVWIDPWTRKAAGPPLGEAFHVACAPSQHGRRCDCAECVKAMAEDHADLLRDDKRSGD